MFETSVAITAQLIREGYAASDVATATQRVVAEGRCPGLNGERPLVEADVSYVRDELDAMECTPAE